MRGVRRSDSRVVSAFAALSFVFALLVRLYWIFRIESPYDTVYSDMNGYVERARHLLSGAASSYPRLTALYPYGTHYLYAGLFGTVGYEQKTIVCIIQAVVCALPAYFFVLFAARLFKRAWAPGLLGVLFAIWQPIVWCTGYFLSEVPYIALLFVNSWLCLRFVERKKGALALGLTGAVLFAVRPQFILTFALLALVYLGASRTRLFRRFSIRRHALVLAPWLVVLAFSVGRHHRLTGHWGLISENGTLNRLFADTDIGRVEARWRASNGDYWSFNVQPPTKRAMNEHELAQLSGYIADAAVLAPVREQHLAGKSVGWRVVRALNNVRLLWDRNTPWPESERARTGLRKTLHVRFNAVARWIVIPLACLAVVVLRKSAALVVVLAHLATLVVLSMFFYPEARYRVPYDPFLLAMALAGVAQIWTSARRWVGGALKRTSGE